MKGFVKVNAGFPLNGFPAFQMPRLSNPVNVGMINASLKRTQKVSANRFNLKQPAQYEWKIGTRLLAKTDKQGQIRAMKQTQSNKLHQYWMEIYNESGIPERSQIEPMAIRDILGDTFILEFEADGTANYRLAGTRLCAAFGKELKGEAFNAPWQDDGRETITNIIDAAARDTTIAVFGSVATSKSGRSISLETVILPLLQNGKKSRRMLGITSSMSRPYWLGTDPLIGLRLSSLRIIEPENSSSLMNSRFTVLKNNNPAPVAPAALAKKVKHLTVLEGGLSLNKGNSNNLV